MPFIESARSLGAACVLVSLVGTPALAGSPTDEAGQEVHLDDAIPARFVMGLKLGGGGTLWDAPDGTVLGQEENGDDFNIPIFDQTRAGYTMSAGFFVEGIFFDHLGLEVGFHFVQHTLFEQIDWSYTEDRVVNGQHQLTSFDASSDEELSWTGLHVPILVKAIVDAGGTRISLGIGPEFEVTSWSRASFKITDGGLRSTSSGDPNDNTFPRDNAGQPVFPQCWDGKTRLPGTRCGFSRVGAKQEDSVYLAVVFGVEIVAGDFIVPIDLHWSYNFSQPKEYLDRTVVDPNTIPNPANPSARPDGVDLKTRDSMYGGLRVGIAYQF